MTVETSLAGAWFVNKPAHISDDDWSIYLEQGEWKSPTPEKHAEALKQISVGDRIGCKSTVNRTTGLSFFNADKSVSVMTIYATGIVTSKDLEAGKLGIDWDAPSEPRDWYLWTLIQPVIQVTGTNPRARELLAFTFEGAQQNLDTFLTDKYWADRYPTPPGFTWIPFYTEFATRLATYKDDRPGLVAAILDVAANEPFLKYLTIDRYEGGTEGPLSDVDPFTVLGTFNRNITDGNKRRVAEKLGRRLGVTADIPSDFDGIPLLNNQNSWFIRYSADRGADDVSLLWAAFEAALAFSDADTTETRVEFAAAYDAAQQVKGVHWNLTLGMYWARPQTFATLEGQSRPYLLSHFGLAGPADGRGYLQLLDSLQQRFSDGSTSITSFPLLSYAAWFEGTHQGTPHSVAGFAQWAVRMAGSIDLEATEHGYKRSTASLMRQARDQAREGASEWPGTFKRAMTEAGNILHFMFKGDVVTAVQADPTAWSATFEKVWESGQPNCLDEFQTTLRGRLSKATPGNATALAALLLLADDAEANAPYNPSRTAKWYQLSDSAGPTSMSSASNRYEAMLTFLDELRADIEGELGFPVSRLEAQGMAWAVTEHPIPAGWDEASRRSLEAFRGEQPAPPRAWLVRPKNVGVETWVERGYVSLAATWLGTPAPGSDAKAVKEAVETGYQQSEYAERRALASEFHGFLSRMRPEDLVCAQAEGRLHIGRITGEAVYDEADSNDRLHREVEWLVGIATEKLPVALSSLLDQPGTVVDLTEATEEILALLQESEPSGGPVSADRPSAATVTGLPPITPEVADSLYTDVDSLQEIVDVLFARRQIVLYGPPGTGKTFIALALAQHIVGQDHASHHQLVQFHPSYAYEDFFEGFRPTETEQGEATFRIEPGPLRRIAADARANPSLPFVLIIDELNRANLAKVFGELYFLLEYRDQSIQLQYNPAEKFRLPANLFIIGTMNTADRSVALLDAAMRRRFAFVELHPDEPPVRDVLTKFLKANAAHQDPRADLLTALNAAIEDNDRDFKIGPSYLMRKEAGTSAGLDRIWRYDLMPLLEEHYYGRMTRHEIHERFGLPRLSKVLHPSAEASEPASSEHGPNPPLPDQTQLSVDSGDTA